MKSFLLAAVAAVAIGAPAQAGVVFSDTFDTENGGATALNYNNFINFDVTDPTVDLTESGSYTYPCSTTPGLCVDLDGSTGTAGELTTKQSFLFNAGDIVSVSVLASGNGRSANTAPDSFQLGFVGGDSQTFTGLQVGDPFATYTVSFVAAAAGSLKAFVRGFGGDNEGVVIDDFTVSIAAVPEPAAWGMMLMGFGFIGAALRRRRQPVRVSFA